MQRINYQTRKKNNKKQKTKKNNQKKFNRYRVKLSILMWDLDAVAN